MPNLLVIDDDVHMLSSLNDVLSVAGYKVACAQSGQQALEMANNNGVDLVISDVRMEGMDGIDCISRLSTGRPDLKSIVITGYAADDIPGRAMDIATCDYLRKPFTAEQLIQSVSRALSPPSEDNQALLQQVGSSLSELEGFRKRAFLNFYLGIRSGHLTMASALVAWDKLEGVELQRLEAEKQLQLRLQVRELNDGYLHVSECCRAPATAAPSAQRPEHGLSRIAFQPFYKNIRDGKVSCDQLRLAVAVRQRVQDGSNPTPSDQQLYEQIWR